jgi:hypothetical protein
MPPTMKAPLITNTESVPVAAGVDAGFEPALVSEIHHAIYLPTEFKPALYIFHAETCCITVCACAAHRTHHTRRKLFWIP